LIPERLADDAVGEARVALGRAGGPGNPMPLGKSLSDSQKCLLINWVKGGAK
jgi:hypothetical protein